MFPRGKKNHEGIEDFNALMEAADKGINDLQAGLKGAAVSKADYEAQKRRIATLWTMRKEVARDPSIVGL